MTGVQTCALPILRIETRVGEGTSVKIYFPRAPIESISQALARSAGHSAIRRKTATIMVVDDDSTVRDVTASILEDDLGYNVVRVGSGGAALDLLDRHPDVDLILLDVVMPGMSGLEVARHAQLKCPAIPILFVTGYVDKSTLGEVSEDRIIKKPFIGDELVEKISAALVRSSRRPAEKEAISGASAAGATKDRNPLSDADPRRAPEGRLRGEVV